MNLVIGQLNSARRECFSLDRLDRQPIDLTQYNNIEYNEENPF